MKYIFCALIAALGANNAIAENESIEKQRTTPTLSNSSSNVDLSEEYIEDLIKRVNTRVRSHWGSREPILLHVGSVMNATSGPSDPAPVGGARSETAFEAALKLARGSKVKVIDIAQCGTKKSSNFKGRSYAIHFTITGFKNNVENWRRGIELTAEMRSGSGYGGGDTSSSATKSFMQVQWRLTPCEDDFTDGSKSFSETYNVEGESITDAKTFTLLARILGVYHVNTKSYSFNEIKARDALVRFGMADAMMKLMDMSSIEMDIMTHGCTIDFRVGMNTHMNSMVREYRGYPSCNGIPRFDPKSAGLLFETKYRGSKRPPESTLVKSFGAFRIDRLESNVERAYVSIIVDNVRVYTTRFDQFEINTAKE